MARAFRPGCRNLNIAFVRALLTCFILLLAGCAKTNNHSMPLTFSQWLMTKQTERRIHSAFSDGENFSLTEVGCVGNLKRQTARRGQMGYEVHCCW
jgi:hypothetical protein